MNEIKDRLMLTKDDHKLLISYLKGRWDKTLFDRRNAEELQTELNRAKLVNSDDLPHDVVRINSKVKIKAEITGKVMELTLVTPDRADIKRNQISIMAPMGTALIGFRQGQKVKWQVPAGKTTFTILEVINENR
jgi:regulator of nucleoside diphosphate kinase